MKSKHLIPMSLAIFLITISTGWAGVAKEGEKPEYTSNYKHTNRIVDDFNIGDTTNAELRIVLMARINKSPKETFEIVSKDIAKWTDEIQTVEWEHNNSEIVGHFGKGSVRKCQVDDDLVVEDIVYWKEGKVFAYRMNQNRSTMTMPFTDHLASVLQQDI